VSATPTVPSAGEVWRRRSDGVKTTIILTEPSWASRRQVVHRARRRTWTELTNFLRKYEYVQGPEVQSGPAEDSEQ